MIWFDSWEKQEVVGGFAVAEALVEFFAEGFGETGEFAGAVHSLVCFSFIMAGVRKK